MVVDVRQSQSRFSPDRTKLLDRMGGLDGRGHRDLNAQVTNSLSDGRGGRAEG